MTCAVCSKQKSYPLDATRTPSCHSTPNHYMCADGHDSLTHCYECGCGICNKKFTSKDKIMRCASEHAMHQNCHAAYKKAGSASKCRFCQSPKSDIFVVAEAPTIVESSPMTFETKEQREFLASLPSSMRPIDIAGASEEKQKVTRAFVSKPVFTPSVEPIVVEKSQPSKPIYTIPNVDVKPELFEKPTYAQFVKDSIAFFAEIDKKTTKQLKGVPSTFQYDEWQEFKTKNGSVAWSVLNTKWPRKAEEVLPFLHKYGLRRFDVLRTWDPNNVPFSTKDSDELYKFWNAEYNAHFALLDKIICSGQLVELCTSYQKRDGTVDGRNVSEDDEEIPLSGNPARRRSKRNVQYSYDESFLLDFIALYLEIKHHANNKSLTTKDILTQNEDLQQLVLQQVGIVIFLEKYLKPANLTEFVLIVKPNLRSNQMISYQDYIVPNYMSEYVNAPPSTKDFRRKKRGIETKLPHYDGTMFQQDYCNIIDFSNTPDSKKVPKEFFYRYLWPYTTLSRK